MLTVVLMDDEYYFRQAVKKYLMDWNDKYTVIGEAKNGKEGLELIRDLHPDIALVDINMPIMSGIDMVEELSREGLLCKIIILTGYGEFEYAQRAIRLGVHDYLLKPVDQLELSRCLEKVAKQIEEEANRIAQYAELKSREHTTTVLIMDHFVNKVVRAKTEKEWVEIEQIAKEFPEIQNRISYQVVLIDIYFDDTNYWKESDAPLCRFGIINVLTELFECKNIQCFTGVDEDKSICTILSSDMSRAELEETVSETLSVFYDIVQHRLFLSVLLSVGTAKEHITRSAESYEEARCVQKLMFLYHEKGIYYRAKLNLNDRLSSFPGQRVDRLLFFMRTNNTEEINLLLDKIFGEMKKSETLPEVVLRKVHDMVSCALGFAQEMQLPVFCEEQGIQLLPPDFSKDSIDEIHTKVGSYIQKIMQLVYRKELEKQSLLPEQVVRYIEENYDKSGLTLEKLSKVFGVSKTILCQQFKDIVKMTVGEFLLQTRMLRAKEHLDEGYRNIAFIAEKCGYEDAGYFRKCFKKYFGIAPRENIKMK